MPKNPFFINKGPFSLKDIVNECGLVPKSGYKKILVSDVKILNETSKEDLTFFYSIKYKNNAQTTKAKICVTSEKLKKYLPKKCIIIAVDNVLLTATKITKLFYPDSAIDNFNNDLKIPEDIIKNKKDIIFGRNILVGRNVKIGANSLIGHNTVIENNVSIGDNCSIGSNVILRNCLIKNNVHILDGCIIGKKGFGFFPNNSKNFRYPHIGYVKISENCEIGAGCTIDRGSLSNTVIGKNTLVGKNVLIGKNTSIGHNTIIEDNVIVGANCSIGSNVILRNTIVKNNVHILDGCIIGKKGFGFFPDNKKNFRYPHIGFVFINDNCEIGAGCTFDRGSLSNTVIGKNTFFDNQVHIAHNVKIGDNCMIAGQVGIAGSSTIGSNVMIGGQAGISGHLKIGNNVQIGGGSGVIKNIPDNSKVMGYPATDIRNFLKEKRN